MSKEEKRKYINKHFSKQCVIVLSDVKKTKYFKNLQKRKDQASEGSSGRKKHSCYICFQKFYTKDDLTAHKFIHFNEKSDDSCSDNNDVPNSSLKETRSTEKDREVKMIYGDDKVVIETEEPVKETKSFETENIEQTSKPENAGESKGTDYKCLKCNVYFVNQVDVKAHVHIQYFCKYFCRLCDRQFNTKGGFIVHVLQHDMTNISKLSYRCNKCPFSFDDCYKLKRHYATVHNVENKNTAIYAESIVNNRDNPPIFIENVQPSPTTVTTELTSWERFKRDTDNPMTGSIPIFDCDVCYDVFSTQKTLNRHKALHSELEKSDDTGADSILIEDDDCEVVEKDSTSDKQQIISSLTTTPKPAAVSHFITTPMAKLTPIRPNLTPSLYPSKPNILTKEPTSKRQDFNTLEVDVDSAVDKTKITSEITEMLSGRKQAKPKVIPPFNPRSVRKPPKTAVKNPVPVMPKLQTITANPSSPKPTEISPPAGSPKIVSEANQSQYVYVVYPKNSSQSAGMPSGGQALMMVDPSSTTTSASTKFVFQNQGETNTSTIMPNSGPNQFIINQQINTGGVVINPQAGGVPGGFVFNQNLDGPAMRLQEPPMLRPFSGVQNAEGGQMFYVVMSPNQSEAPKQNNELPSDNAQVLQQQAIMPNLTGIIKPDVRRELAHCVEDFKKAVKSDDLIKLQNPKAIVKEKSQKQMSNPYLISERPDITIDDSNSSETMVMTRVIQKKSSEHNSDKNDPQDTPRDDSEIIMPIITSIGTVAEDSKNLKEKVRKDAVSKYESEFAKFLKKSEKNSGQSPKTLKRAKKAYQSLNTQHFKESNDEAIQDLKAARSRTTSAPRNTSASNNEIILLDDNSSSNESVSKEGNDKSNTNPVFKIITTVGQDNSAEQTKPKIFVKKLSDLLDLPQSSLQELETTEKFSNSPFKHCCLHCNLQLKDWYELRIHLKGLHNLYACVFSGCSVFNSLDDYRKHITQIHHCSRCNYEFSNLQNHQVTCPLDFQTNNVQNNQDISKNIT